MDSIDKISGQTNSPTKQTNSSSKRRGKHNSGSENRNEKKSGKRSTSTQPENQSPEQIPQIPFDLTSLEDSIKNVCTFQSYMIISK